MGEIASVDLAVAVILGIALLRGLFLGLVREAFSIAALAAACVVVRAYAGPAGDRLVDLSGGQIGAAAAPWVAGAVLGVVTVAAVAIVGRMIQRGARAAGLGWADRAGGVVLGAAEGALVAGVLLLVAVAALGRAHPLIAGSRSIAALEQLEHYAGSPDLREIDVAAPPRS